MTRRKITNVSGDDLIVPWLNGRLVAAGEVVLVAEEDVPAYLCQPTIWEAGDAETLAAYEDVVIAAAAVLEQAAAQYAEAHPEPWAPEPAPLGADATVAEQEQPAGLSASEVEATPLEAQPAPAPPPAPASAPEPEPAPAADPAPAAQDLDPEPDVEPRLPPRLQALLDRTSAPAASVLTGSLPAQPRL